ncbi:hypothetical protein NEMIN01_1989 [Nematocida minor]|uniref:uncharacterized protein n=1 Tax=Nematocida minor TaxID=1912983 RepID=UPI00221FA280|nr:uncharacterized protein NEMIN01_1989 [Nematocida minor]KAI5192375.1 hypothetical protein NEMIN01_1989 [Nematocida minor]
MAAKEVQFKIDVNGMVQACMTVNSVDALSEAVQSYNRISFMLILKYILDGNLKIESTHSPEEKKVILDMVKSSMYLYFVYNSSMLRLICRIHDSLRSGARQMLKKRCILLINELIKPNPLIYDIDHGITRKVDMHEPLDDITEDDNPDLSPRTCTLEINDTNALGLKGMLQLVTESLDRQTLSYISSSVQLEDMDIYKKYLSIREFYTLDQLYTLTKDDVLLVDYGLKMICGKYLKIEKLIKLIREIRVVSTKYQDVIGKEISNLFSPEDLKIAISICNHLEKIAAEKSAQKRIIKAIGYMAHHTKLLDQMDGPKVVKVKADLSDFYKKYAGDTCLAELIYRERNKAFEEVPKNKDLLDMEKANYSEKRESFQEWENSADRSSPDYSRIEKEKKEELERIRHRINSLENTIYLLTYEDKKGYPEFHNIKELSTALDELPGLSLLQKQYLLRKIKEFGKAVDIRVVTDEAEEKKVPEERKSFTITTSRVNIVKILMLSAIFIAASVLLIRFSKNRAVSGINHCTMKKWPFIMK